MAHNLLTRKTGCPKEAINQSIKTNGLAVFLFVDSTLLLWHWVACFTLLHAFLVLLLLFKCCFQSSCAITALLALFQLFLCCCSSSRTIVIFLSCYNSFCAAAGLFMLLLVFLCCCNSFHTLLLHALLPCVLLLHTLLFSHIVFLAHCYLTHYSFQMLLFSRIVLLTCNSKYLLAHQVVALLTLMPLFFLYCCALISFISMVHPLPFLPCAS